MGTKSSSSSTKQKINVQAEAYYKNLTKGNEISNDSSPKEQIQMYVSIKSAETNIDYTVKILASEGNAQNCKALGMTDKYQSDENGFIQFNLIIILDYYFEKQQFLTFSITKGNQNFSIDTTLGNIMGSRGQVLTKDIFVNEKLLISASTLINNNLSVNISLTAFYEVKGSSMFYTIKRGNKNTNNNVNNVNNFNSQINSNELISVYKSEVKAHNTVNGIGKNNGFIFNKIKIPSSVLCNGEFNNTIVIEFHDFNNLIHLGSYSTTVDKLTMQDRNFTITKTKTNLSINVQCICDFVKENTFIDYLRGGLQLALSIGIDFTGSNGHPKDEISLHYIDGNSPNSYERAIRSCGDTLAYYDFDQMFPVYGYGAVIQGSNNQVSHCFPLNFTNDPYINTIDTVLTTYRNNLLQINFRGPTLFAPLINQVIANLKSESNKMLYYILLILTDGNINDMDQTIDALVEGSFLPFSVIIVGIGRNDFGNMNVLDADDSPLIDSKGRKSVRDLVQFVPFYQFENNGMKLAEHVLEEVPRQVVDYYRLIGVPPGDPTVYIS